MICMTNGVNMNCNLKLVSPIPPSVNHYLGTRVVVKKVKGKNVPMAIVYETTEAKKYKKAFIKYVKNEVEKQGWKIDISGKRHIYMDCVFYFPRIDMDANNYFKCLADAITESEVVWKDDNIVCERVNAIYYDNENPRIEINISFVDYIGIFDNKEELDKFELNCSQCTRYTRNCSILNKAKDGRIQDEIVDLNCSKFKLKK